MVMVVMTSASSTLYPCLRASLSSEHPRAWGPAPTRPLCRGGRRGQEVAQRQSPEEADQGSGLTSRSQPHPGAGVESGLGWNLIVESDPAFEQGPHEPP